jgi:hypothetical protein
MSKPGHKRALDDDDDLDDLLAERERENEKKLRLEAERLLEKFEDCDFEDIDAILGGDDQNQDEKKYDALEDLDDDALDDIIASVVTKKQ